jgi:hypothetical protein
LEDILGVVMLGDGVVGQFSLDEEENITIFFNTEGNNVTDMLEMAAENGLTFTLALQPDFDGYMPQHYKEVI